MMRVLMLNGQSMDGRPAGMAQQQPAPAIPRTGPERPTTLCVITCHNYGRYLKECVDSCRSQTVPFTRIVVVDDSSTDETAVVAQGLGVEYVRGEWRDVAQARNAGVIGERTSYLLFMDGDDTMPADYHAKLLAAFTSPAIGVTYARHRYVDEQGEFLKHSPYILPYDRNTLLGRNIAGTPSLMRRECFDQVGGWWGERKGFEDWAMWLRVTAAGWQMQLAEVALNYRRHAAQMHKTTLGREAFRLRVIEHCTKTAIVTLFSGRNVAAYFAFLEQLMWEREGLHVVAIDNSRSESFRSELLEALAKTQLAFTYVRHDEAATEEATPAELSDSTPLRRHHGQALTRHLVRLYQAARLAVPKGVDFVWSIEDDVTPPVDALRCLHWDLLMHHKRGMVAAMVPSRHGQGGYIAQVGASLDKAARLQGPITGGVLSTTWGCTLFRREVWDGPAFRGSWDWSGAGTAFDYAFGEDVRGAGWEIGIVPVECDHQGCTQDGFNADAIIHK